MRLNAEANESKNEEFGGDIPKEVVEADLLQKARFAHLEVSGYSWNGQLTNDAPFR